MVIQGEMVYTAIDQHQFGVAEMYHVWVEKLRDNFHFSVCYNVGKNFFHQLLRLIVLLYDSFNL